MTDLSAAQSAYVKALAEQLPQGQRLTFEAAVKARTGGRPADLTLQRVATLVLKEIKRGDLHSRRA
jgi:hypothetical protein